MIRILTPGDADDLFALRQRSLRECPLAFGSSVEDDRHDSPEAVREMLRNPDGPKVFGAFREDDRLVGMLGIIREPKTKQRHRVYFWGIYVVPKERRSGIGERLLTEAIDHVRTMEGVDWACLSVTSGAPAARRLYEKAGFVAWGHEPDALRHEGESADETHMTMALHPKPS